MIEITDTVTKILSTDKNTSYSILTFIDINLLCTYKSLDVYVHKMVDKFPVLKQYIVIKDSDIFLESDPDFDITKHYKIIYDKQDNFDTYTDIFVNLPFETKSKWVIYFIFDKETNKERLYFKIDHAYADGYKIIEMLTLSLKNVSISTKFKYKSIPYIKILYYLIIGTLTLLIINFKVFINILFSSKSQEAIDKTLKTDHIKCKPLKLSIIKEFVTKHHITINDFLYSLMIKTDYLYTNTIRNVSSLSPINISGGTHFNNMAPMFNINTNNTDNIILLKTVHETFNCYKYSLYIQFISFILNNITSFLSLNNVNSTYNSIIQKCDYVYSNIIILFNLRVTFDKNYNV